MRELQPLETEFFRNLNRVIEPLVRAGFGNPVLWPTGTIVVETSGRRTGRRYDVPVVATRFGELFVFSTVRRHSQWVKNLAANPEVRYWMAGQSRAARAFVFAPEVESLPPDSLPLQVGCLANMLRQQSSLLGISFAILAPRS
ncbi:MAG TPA: nitroreductase/quinone reductase family protein [Blastocatellia bacterium]|nr:nitroreductase/quinone reductase family protein [Blastocatellia bacterium]